VITDLVGPLEPVSFYHGTTTALHFAPLPRNTCDPRVKTCVQHHLACDCREALLAEEITERRINHDDYHRHRDAARAVAWLHQPRREASPYCGSCGGHWPCPTFNLVRPLLEPYDLPGGVL
jgi:hypothetical protein